MTKSYIKRLIELGEQLQDQLNAEQDENFDSVPFALANQVNYICGFISSLKENDKEKKK
jgi:hypothetical protein